VTPLNNITALREAAERYGTALYTLEIVESTRPTFTVIVKSEGSSPPVEAARKYLTEALARHLPMEMKTVIARLHADVAEARAALSALEQE
jgi:hypothetical protein